MRLATALGAVPEGIEDALNDVPAWTGVVLAEALIGLYNLGVDGVMMGFVDYLDGTRQFGKEIVPLLREAGIR